MKILIVEDEGTLAQTIATVLKTSKYCTQICTSAEEAFEVLSKSHFDVIILDRMLPGMDGLEFARLLRKEGATIPILFLSALGEYEHRIEGLDSGGDDYLVKPFHNGELLARIRALLRRYGHAEIKYTVGNVSLDIRKMQMCGPNGSIDLKGKLGSLAELMFSKSDQVITRKEIFASIWGIGINTEEAVIDNYIMFFRRSLRQVGATAHIVTVHGIGYRFTER